MMRKNNNAKSTKALSKPDDSDCFRVQNSEQYFQSTSDNLQLTRLEHLITAEISMREKSYDELLGMINHLQETKKSKIPVKFEKLTSKKFFSPVKHLPPKQNQPSFRNTSKTHLTHDPNLLHKIESVCQEVEELKLKVAEISTFTMNVPQDLGYFNQEIEFLKSEFPRKQEASENALMQDCQTLVEEKMNQVWKHISEQMGDKTDILLKFSEQMKEAMLRVQKEVENFEENIQKQMKIATENIAETKQTIEQSLFGGKERGISTVSIELTEPDHPRKPHPLGQKLGFLERRIDGFEKRLTSAFETYLSKPFSP